MRTPDTSCSWLPGRLDTESLHFPLFAFGALGPSDVIAQSKLFGMRIEIDLIS